MQTDFSKHAVTVMHESGLYRHLRCRVDNSFCMGFDVVTWPGHLSISGDMGCFVFTRVDDMFTFFRGHEDAPNLGYSAKWGEMTLEKLEQVVEILTAKTPVQVAPAEEPV